MYVRTPVLRLCTLALWLLSCAGSENPNPDAAVDLATSGGDQDLLMSVDLAGGGGGGDMSGGGGNDLAGGGGDMSGGGGNDLSGGPGADLAGNSNDLSGPGVDLSGPGVDLSGPAKDLATAVDLAVALDMSKPDLATVPDLSTPDLAKPDMTPPCVVAPQGGCAAGQKCTTRDGVSTQCDPSGATARAGICTVAGTGDSCVAGSICTAESPTGPNQCRAFCTKDSDCGMRSYCDLTLGMAMAFKVCTNPCNAIYPSAGCSTGLGCYAYGAEHTDCLKPGAAVSGAPCVSSLDCTAGQVCLGAAGAGRCRRICAKGDASNCAAGDTCVGLMGGGVTWMTYGACCPASGC